MAKWWQLATREVIVLLVVFGLGWGTLATTNAAVAAEQLGEPSTERAELSATEQLKLSVEGNSVESQFKEVSAIIDIVIKILMVGAAVCFMGLVLLAGYKLVFASDKEKQLSSAKNNFMTGLTGLAILAAAWWIVQVISKFTGVTVPGT